MLYLHIIHPRQPSSSIGVFCPSECNFLLLSLPHSSELAGRVDTIAESHVYGRCRHRNHGAFCGDRCLNVTLLTVLVACRNTTFPSVICAPPQVTETSALDPDASGAAADSEVLVAAMLHNRPFGSAPGSSR